MTRPSKRSTSLSEDAVQRAVMAHLAARSRPNTVYFAVPNGGARRKVEAKILKGLGVRAGVPDVAIVHNGRPYFLELKTEKGRLSPTQQTVMADLERAGASVAVAYGLDEAIEILETWNILKTGKNTHNAGNRTSPLDATADDP